MPNGEHPTTPEPPATTPAVSPVDVNATNLAPIPTESHETTGPLAVVRTPAKKVLDAIYLRLEETGIDFYQSAMHASFGWPLRFLSYRFFRHAHVDDAQVAKIREAAAKGTVVYVMRHKSLLDYLFLNWLFLTRELPLARFANEVNLWLWLPWGKAVRTLIAKTAWFLRHGLLPDPIDSGWVEDLLTRGKTILLFLKRRRTLGDFIFLQHPSRDVAEALIAGARASDKPVFAVPVAVFWERRPKTGKKTPVDVVFGEADKPSWFRKMWSFLRNFREGIVSFGEPLELKEFLHTHEADAADVRVKKLRWVMLQHLWRERKVVTGSKILPVSAVRKRILNDPEVRSEIERVAQREGKPPEAIRRRLDKTIVKMAADQRWNWLMVAERILTWVWNNIYSGMEVDQQGAKRLKEAVKDAPLVLIPSHRSHADYLIMSYAMYHLDMALPLVAAGDNLSFWPMGTVFRRMGGFFIRRTFKGDALYALALERYLKILLKSQATLEFFIEGGRSRTGRVLRPKLGILTMIVRAWEAGAVKDVALAPLSINYEKVIEEKSYIRELEGGAKTKESVGALLKVFKVLTKRYGRVFVEFAEPITLRTAFGCDAETFGAKPEGEKRAAIKALGDHIANGINGVTVVTPSQIVAAALLAHGKRGMLQSSLVETARFLLDFLDVAGVRRSPVLTGEEAPRGIESAADGFVAEKVLRRGSEEGETWYVIEEDQRISLDFYKNMVLLFFAPAAFIAAELATEAPIARARLFERYRALRERLRLEFPDVDPEEQEGEFEAALLSLARAGVIPDALGETITVVPAGRRRLRLLASLVHSFFEANYAAARAVAGAEPGPEKALEARLDSAAKKMWRNGVLERKESTARPLLANAIKQLIAAGVLQRGDAAGDPPTGFSSGKLRVDEPRRRAEEQFWSRFLRL